MSNYDPTELISVCESILEDGEINGEELYYLADWLNQHPEACVQWPGNLLVSPLQDSWADGKITKTELRQISRLLVKIYKEWGKLQAYAAIEQASETVAKNIPFIDLTLPRVPAIPIVLPVKSHTEKRTVYMVDLSTTSCTCPDWRSRRDSLPHHHLSRCCKHVFDAVGHFEPCDGWPGWLGAFLDLSWPAHPNQDWMVFRVGPSLVLASTAPSGWANVYAEEDSAYDRYGFNVLEDRWAYGIEPRGSHLIRRAILEAC